MTPLRGALVAATLLAAGCAVNQPAPVDNAESRWHERRTRILALSDWTLDGRIALRTSSEGWNGMVTWSQQGEHLDMRVNGPLGIGGFRLTGTERLIVLTTRDGERYEFDDPQSDLQRELGWSVPLDALRYWVLGVPAPGSPAAPTLDAQGRLAELEQLGWAISYERYRDADGTEMPRKLVVSDGAVTVKLVVDRWNTGAESAGPIPVTTRGDDTAGLQARVAT